MSLSVFRPKGFSARLTNPLNNQVESKAIERAKRLSARAPKIRQVTSTAVDGLEDAIAVLDDTCAVLETLRNRIKNLSEPVIAASAEPDAATRALFADEYDDRRETIAENLMGSQDGANVLLGDGDGSMTVSLTDSFAYRIAKFELLPDTDGLTLPAPLGAFEDNEDIVSSLRGLENALENIDRALAHYRQDKAFLENKLAVHQQTMVASEH